MKPKPAAKAKPQPKAKTKLSAPKSAAHPRVEADVKRLAQELQEYQFELEVQNEELTQTREKLEITLNEYTDLYDFAPVGYFTLMLDGKIRNANQSGANLLGVDHDKLINQRLNTFASKTSRPVYKAFFEKLLSGQGRETCELEFLKNKAEVIFVHVEATCFEGGKECRAVLVDITERKQAETALRESEEKYRRLFDYSTLGIFQSTPDGKPISVNNAFAHMFGYQSPEDAMVNIKNVGTDVFADPNRRAEIIRMLAENPNQRIFENVYRRKDGSTFFGNLHAIPIRDANGALIRTEGIIENITERKLTEIALKQSEAKYHLLADHMTDTIWLMDFNLKFTYVSPSLEKTRGYTLAELQQFSLDQLLTPASAQLAMEIFSNELPVVLSDPAYYSSVRTVEFEFYNRDGSLHSAESKLSVIRDESGNPVAILGQDRDITERKQAEMALRDSELFVKGVLNSLTAHIAVLDKQGVIVSVNDAWLNFARENDNPNSNGYLGYNYLTACENAIQQGDQIALQVAQGVRAVLDGSLPQFSTEYPLPAPTQLLWFTITVLPQHKSHHGAIILHQNITERKQAEDELHHAKEMLTATNVELKTALARQKKLAHTDALTGINNRRRLYELAEHEVEITMRYQQPLSVMMFDIDHFKQVNDTFGHAVGDQMLQLVTRTACRELRSTDVIGRYGGEEFVIILPMTNAQQAYPLAERIRERVSALRVPTEKGAATVTLSVGIVETHGARSESAEALIRRADQAMYAAKQSGRNRTEIEKA